MFDFFARDLLLLRLRKRWSRFSKFFNWCVKVSTFANNSSIDEDETPFASVAATVCDGKEKWLRVEENSKIVSAIIGNCSTEFTSKVGAIIVWTSRGNREIFSFKLLVHFLQSHLKVPEDASEILWVLYLWDNHLASANENGFLLMQYFS